MSTEPVDSRKVNAAFRAAVRRIAFKATIITAGPTADRLRAC